MTPSELRKRIQAAKPGEQFTVSQKELILMSLSAEAEGSRHPMDEVCKRLGAGVEVDTRQDIITRAVTFTRVK